MLHLCVRIKLASDRGSCSVWSSVMDDRLSRIVTFVVRTRVYNVRIWSWNAWNSAFERASSISSLERHSGLMRVVLRFYSIDQLDELNDVSSSIPCLAVLFRCTRRRAASFVFFNSLHTIRVRIKRKRVSTLFSIHACAHDPSPFLPRYNVVSLYRRVYIFMLVFHSNDWNVRNAASLYAHAVDSIPIRRPSRTFMRRKKKRIVNLCVFSPFDFLPAICNYYVSFTYQPFITGTCGYF